MFATLVITVPDPCSKVWQTILPGIAYCLISTQRPRMSKLFGLYKNGACNKSIKLEMQKMLWRLR